MDSGRELQRSGLAAGIGAYLLWGLFPLFWPLLRPAGALEILAQRVTWGLVTVAAALLLLRRGWGWLRPAATGRRGVRLGAASTLIAVNWLTYIWAVNNGHVVEASLGYFINPLVNVVLGVILFGERITRGAGVGVLLALAGVVVIASGSWRTLWISLVLAFSFGLYGVAKKRTHLPALQGLFAESAFLLPASLAYIAFLELTGAGHFAATPTSGALLVMSGAITAIPLWLFAVAAPRLPLGIIGVLQYLAPTIQFLLGITLFREHVTPSYWAGLVLVWIGSAAYLSFSLVRRPIAPS